MSKSIKSSIKKTFELFGYEIRKKNLLVRRRDLSDFLKHIKCLGFEPQTIIDVGVAIGTFPLYENFPDSTHLLIEPLCEFEHVIEEICQKYDALYVMAAAGSNPGKIKINVHPDLSSSSIYEENENKFINSTSREVNQIRIDDICEDKGLKGPYLIKIDVQGAELDVLRGSTNIMKNTEVIILEVSLLKLYKGGPEFFDVVDYMYKKDFVVYDIYGGQYRQFDSVLLQLDVAFVKEKGLFRSHHFIDKKPDREKRFENKIKKLKELGIRAR
jgi:FkbM family methyltransferase